jgi:hypothetical protein
MVVCTLCLGIARAASRSETEEYKSDDNDEGDNATNHSTYYGTDIGLVTGTGW